MGNYNCQECVDKEVNIINELLLDNKLFPNSPIDQDNPNVSHASRIRNLRASKEDLKRVIESTNLSEEQKNYVQKIIKENSNDFFESPGKNTIKLRIGQNKNYGENINNINENDISQEQQKIIESQKEQILAQQKIIEEYKKQQFLLEQKQNKLKEEEENLKKEIEKAKSKQIEQNQEHEQKENMQGINIKIIDHPKENQESIQENNHNKEIIQEQVIPIEKNTENYEIIKQNIHPQDGVQEKEGENEPEDSQTKDKEEKLINIEKTRPQMQGIGIGMGQGFPQNPQSQRFKIETYEPIEPIEPGPKNSNENDIIIDDINENNENDDNNNNDSDNSENNDVIQIKSNEPIDSKRVDLRKPIIPKEVKEEDIDNINNYTNYIQDKVNLREKGPKDNDKNNIEYKFKGSFNEDNNNNNNLEIMDKMNIIDTGPRDSKRKDIQPKFNSNEDKIYSFNKNNLQNEKQFSYQSKQKNQMDLNKNELDRDKALFYKDQEINNNIVSNVVLSKNKYIQQQQNIDMPSSHRQFHYIKKEILNPSNQEYIIQKNQQNNIIRINQTQQQYYSPVGNDINNDTSNNNMENRPTYENEINYIKNENQIRENQVDIGSYSNKNNNKKGNINSIGIENEYQEQQYENSQNSQKEYDMTISDRDNPLIYSDDIGNMNYLEKQYEAYQDKMNQDNENI